jgi:hypothetical protein
MQVAALRGAGLAHQINLPSLSRGIIYGERAPTRTLWRIIEMEMRGESSLPEVIRAIRKLRYLMRRAARACPSPETITGGCDRSNSEAENERNPRNLRYKHFISIL